MFIPINLLALVCLSYSYRLEMLTNFSTTTIVNEIDIEIEEG